MKLNYLKAERRGVHTDPFPKKFASRYISFARVTLRYNGSYTRTYGGSAAIHRDYNRPLIVARFDLVAATRIDDLAYF